MLYETAYKKNHLCPNYCGTIVHQQNELLPLSQIITDHISFPVSMDKVHQYSVKSV